MSNRTRLAAGALVVTFGLIAGACSSSDAERSFAGKPLGEYERSGGSGRSGGERVGDDAPGDADFVASGSVNQVWVVDAEPGASLELVGPGGKVVADATADDAGSHVFRKVRAGSGYRVRDRDGGTRSDAVDVSNVEGSTPDQSFYDDQTLVEGFQYITTRDGTTLSAAVYLPPGPGPFPTVVEYSGYDPSNPTRDLRGDVAKLGIDADSLCDSVKILCSTPAQPGSLLAAAMGYAVVAVNVRGTGCSGGSYDFFEPLQLLDGYDVIETVAAQDWVRGGKVGMVGLSYPGISQLFVASTNPPHLAAITPLSVYDDTARGVLAPGGLFNEGFALAWARNVLTKAEPLGQGWEQKIVDLGDTTCADNQKLRGQNVDAVAKALSSEFYDPELADPVNPSLWVDRIDVPVFMTGAWQDEQTGPRFVNLWDKFTNAPVRRFIGFNGAHADGYSPETLVEWKLFLDLYVAGERAPLPGFLRSFGPALVADIFGATVQFPEERLLDGDIDDLRAAYESEPEVTIMWDRGANPSNPGAPESTGRTTFPSWPPSQVEARRWYLGADGSLGDDEPGADGGASRWVANPALAQTTTLPGDKESEAFKAEPAFEWAADAPGDAAVFVSEPLARDTAILGAGSADLWIRVDAEDADLGITLSEVRPDGNETYLQSGIGRALLREPGRDATELEPRQTGLEADARPLRPGEWTLVRMEILPVGHVLRKGSRLRISIHTPGGDKPSWAWIVDPDARPTIDIGHDADHPSSIVLPVVPGLTGYQTAYPPCPSLRGQPCRRFTPYRNTPAPR